MAEDFIPSRLSSPSILTEDREIVFAYLRSVFFTKGPARRLDSIFFGLQTNALTQTKIAPLQLRESVRNEAEFESEVGPDVHGEVEANRPAAAERGGTRSSETGWVARNARVPLAKSWQSVRPA